MPFVLSGIIKTYLMTKNRLLEEENLRDEELGRTHYYSSSKVVGASQLKKKNAKVGLICFIVLGAVFTIPSFACFFLEPIPQEEMIKVEGTIDYIKLDEDDSDYIANLYFFFIRYSSNNNFIFIDSFIIQYIII